MLRISKLLQYWIGQKLFFNQYSDFDSRKPIGSFLEMSEEL